MQPELSGAHFFVLQKLGKKNSGNGARIKLPKLLFSTWLKLTFVIYFKLYLFSMN